MNPFVNNQQRGVELPKGCKDLIDVLQQTQSNQPALFESGKLEVSPQNHFGFETAGLGALEFQIFRLFAVATGRQILVIFGQGFGVVVYRRDGLLSMRLTKMEPAREQAVREIFKKASLYPIEDAMKGTTYAFKYPLPNALDDAVAFMNILFRKGYGLSDGVRLDFRYWEIS